MLLSDKLKELRGQAKQPQRKLQLHLTLTLPPTVR